MYPVLFKLGPVEIKTYGLMLALSFVIGFLIASKRAEKHGIESAVLLDLCFYILLSSIIGSRLYYAVTHLSEFSSNPLEVFYIWEGGLSMMGGVILSLLVSWLFLRVKRIDFFLMGDILAPSIALGVGVTRIGCFMYGCCYGAPTDLPWGCIFPVHSAAGSAHPHVAIHPTQLYASAYGILIFVILMLVSGKKPPQGFLIGLLLVLYSIARFLIDFVRDYETSQFVVQHPVPLTNNQILCIFLFIFGAHRIWVSYSKKKRTISAD